MEILLLRKTEKEFLSRVKLPIFGRKKRIELGQGFFSSVKFLDIIFEEEKKNRA